MPSSFASNSLVASIPREPTPLGLAVQGVRRSILSSNEMSSPFPSPPLPKVPLQLRTAPRVTSSRPTARDPPDGALIIRTACRCVLFMVDMVAIVDPVGEEDLPPSSSAADAGEETLIPYSTQNVRAWQVPDRTNLPRDHSPSPMIFMTDARAPSSSSSSPSYGMRAISNASVRRLYLYCHREKGTSNS